MRILFLCSEYEGLIKTGGLADACRGMVQGLVNAGHQVTVVLPRYGALYGVPTDAAQSVYFDLGGRHFGCAVRQFQLDGACIALIEHHDFFQRNRPYDDGQHGYSDNPLRFAFYCKAALEWALLSGQEFDVIHGHDWQTACAAYYLKRFFSQTPIAATPFVFTIHNGAYQQICAAHWRDELAIEPELRNDVNFLALALRYADKINTVSDGYRQELMHEPLAGGLAELYQQRASDFSGILNGCDYDIWDPMRDSYLPATFDIADMTGKGQCKSAFLRHCGLSTGKGPLFVAISRLTCQKGYDYLLPALAQWLPTTKAQTVIVGTGEARYCQQLEQLQQQNDNFRFIQGYSDELAHQLEAAGDFFLMPSLFEPCGLNQMYSLRYGAVPLVRLTGGLKDTVTAWPGRGATGIGFDAANTESMLVALQQAELLYSKKASYRRVQQNGMQQQFSWQLATSRYEALYQEVVKTQ